MPNLKYVTNKISYAYENFDRLETLMHNGENGLLGPQKPSLSKNKAHRLLDSIHSSTTIIA